jgi:hypothetical protein
MPWSLQRLVTHIGYLPKTQAPPNAAGSVVAATKTAGKGSGVGAANQGMMSNPTTTLRPQLWFSKANLQIKRMKTADLRSSNCR